LENRKPQGLPRYRQIQLVHECSLPFRVCYFQAVPPQPADFCTGLEVLDFRTYPYLGCAKGVDLDPPSLRAPQHRHCRWPASLGKSKLQCRCRCPKWRLFVMTCREQTDSLHTYVVKVASYILYTCYLSCRSERGHQWLWRGLEDMRMLSLATDGVFRG
jgi:hypothetical protein